MTQELKKQLNKFAVFARWLPLALPYWLARYTGASWQTQTRLMPPPRVPLIVWVDIPSITLETTKKTRFSGLSFAWRGNWDRDNVRKLCSIEGTCHEESPFKPDFDTVRDLCIDNRPLEQIDEYRRIMTALKAGRSPRGCKTPAQVGDYFAALKKANHSTATQGYKTSTELGGMARDEISVWITRDGQLAYGGWANHRLAMAELNKIKRVPVSILGAHPDWLIEQCKLYSLPPYEAMHRSLDNLHR
jgi:hypothetical protein